MPTRTHHFHLQTEADTQELAARIAPLLAPGDTLLLEGDIGAGKSAFARALIRARLGRVEDVPSPTFTIVQTYEAPDGDIWHCDLYRLTHPDEALELGLDEAFETAICLIEWPDRLDDAVPDGALMLKFRADETAHEMTIVMDDVWDARLESVRV
ncbi:tRNA (adenosine(37)-N6)-threonylcarbamoyltransferase complex ATPase subunit type 1 TsaE [Yoonia sp. 2307UL14-13]|uniref:tRNA (adenosine(37)-N6)-threonylcarbamoyltransferase complex ATPase subunit type 1 TsaE n=1 Tax=Yoonia sp. 2307UL14-13 TaxID=3126506 RepID=UPI0030A66F69